MMERMTVKETIDTLRIAQAEVEWDYPMDYAAAIDIAVDVLEKQIITDDKKFMVHLITEICDYAKRNNMEPDDTIKIVCNNFLAMLEISTFNGWNENVGNNS